MVSETPNDQKVEETNDFMQTFNLKIAQVIREAQQQHGLRHEDYQRYRSYCSRRLRRLRKSLHFVHGTKHRFQSKKVTTEHLKDIRFLYIPLFMAERAWSYARQLKQESNTEPRKKYHFVSRLQKAYVHANDLKELCESSKCDARTNLEAQAYASSMFGNLKFALEDWKAAMDALHKAQTIYIKLSEALTEDESISYKQQIDDLTISIRYCAYNIGDESALNDLVQMRLSGKNVDEDMFATNLNILISQTREKQAATLSEVNWMGRTVQVRNEKARIFLLNVKESENEIANASDINAKISVYERLLLECKDVLQLVNDELKTESNQNYRGDAPLSSLAFLCSYLGYIKLSKTIARYLLLIETLKEQPANGSKKPNKSQDFIRPYEIVIQNLNEILQLSGLDPSDPLNDEINAKILAYKAYKCFYIAQTFAAANKWLETMAMYQRAGDYVSSALKSSHISLELKEELRELDAEIESNKYSSYALNILGNDKVTDAMANLKLQEDKSMLIDHLETYYDDPSLTRQPSITPFPPEFIPIPCKPLFFDLALNYVEFPSLEDKLEQKSGGLTGFVKGWLGGWKK